MASTIDTGFGKLSILLVCFSWRYEATEGPRVNFVMRESLYLYFNYFIKTVPFWLRNIRFFNTKHPVIILRASLISLFVVTPSHVASSKIECQIFLMFIAAENTGSVNITSRKTGDHATIPFDRRETRSYYRGCS